MLSFHACPPPGEWLNDPNGLVRTADGWMLFAQHRADAPDFALTNWARYTSPDLLDWNCDGAVIKHDGSEQAYSGSIVEDGDNIEAFLTIHDSGLERQQRRRSTDAGLTWREAPLALPATAGGSNVRDPFVFGTAGDWTMLLACPCPWTGWETAPPSLLRCYRSADRMTWREVGTIGPCHPAGVMWEVPVLLRHADGDLLLISCVDRRDGADCSVCAWAGVVTDFGFDVRPGWPSEGRRVDLGPEFYAAIPGLGVDAPIIGWLGSWATARTMAWPGFAGGPISLPRRLSIEGNRIVHVPFAKINAAFTRRCASVSAAGRGTASFGGDESFRLEITGDGCSAVIEWAVGAAHLTVTRTGAGFDWQRRHDDALIAAACRTLTMFVDGPAVEIFIAPDGAAISMALPVAGCFGVELRVAGQIVAVDWTALPHAANLDA